MRVGAAAALLLLNTAVHAEAQTVRCELVNDRLTYGLTGTCRKDVVDARAEGQSQTARSRFWPEGTVWVFLVAGPGTPAPSVGYFFQPFWNDPFQVDLERLSPDRSRIVLRTSGATMIVQDWRETGRDKVSLVFRLNYAPATTNDVAILESALNLMSSVRNLDRHSDQDCRNDDPDLASLFCVMWSAIESTMGRYHHGQPARILVHAVVVEKWPDRYSGHRMVDFNNHPATTVDDVRSVLTLALARARAEVAAAR